MFQEGDWVQIKDSELIGFVDSIFSDFDRFVIFLPDKKGCFSVRLREIHKLGDRLCRDDYPALVDLALQTKDEKWFNELTERMQMDVLF